MSAPRDESALLKAAKGAHYLCLSLLTMREGATDELITEVADALAEAIAPPAAAAEGAAAPTERDLRIARLVYRHTLDQFNELMKVGLGREKVFDALYCISDAELNPRLTEVVMPIVRRMEGSHAKA